MQQSINITGVHIEWHELTFPLYFSTNTNTVHTAAENPKALHANNISILTLCQTCNTLVDNLDLHMKSGDCFLHIGVEVVDNTTKGFQNSVVLNVSGDGNFYGTAKVLDKLDGNRMLHSGE